MFSVYHCLWLAICGCLMTLAVVWLRRKRPSLDWVLSVACVGCVLSELTKVFSVIQLVPSADGSMVYPYLALQHLPLHLCSIQIVMIFYARFAREGRMREAVLAFMYPTCLLGAFLALLMPSIYGSSIARCRSRSRIRWRISIFCIIRCWWCWGYLFHYRARRRFARVIIFQRWRFQVVWCLLRCILMRCLRCRHMRMVNW